MLKRPENEKLIQLSHDEVDDFVDAIVLISHRIKLHYLWRPFLKDKNDDKILELAFVAGADAIITHNLTDFSGVQKAFDIAVTSPKDYLDIIRKDAS